MTLLVLALAILIWGYAEYTRPGPLEVSRVVVVSKGSGLEKIAGRLVSDGIVHHALVFVIGTELSGMARALQAGEYRFPAGASPRDVARLMVGGKTVVRRLTLPEGLTVAQVLSKLATSDGMTGEIERFPEEGTLLPETYHFSHGEDRMAMLERMQQGMTETLTDLWAKRQPDLPYANQREALIMASIIEREAGSEEEKTLIAGVFVNRLRRGMRLQSDPTVAYGIAPAGLQRPLTHADLETDTPFNTYMIPGLPQGAICNPGRFSIHAALNPAKTNFLYFVADGAGGHVFAETLSNHNRNVARWRRLRDESNRPDSH